MKFVIILGCGRSGTELLQSLFDNHPQILQFPGVIMFNPQKQKDEIHCGHFRFKVAEEMGYEGIEAYRVNPPRDILYLTAFTETCYKHYIELKNLKNDHRPEHKYL